MGSETEFFLQMLDGGNSPYKHSLAATESVVKRRVLDIGYSSRQTETKKTQGISWASGGTVLIGFKLALSLEESLLDPKP